MKKLTVFCPDVTFCRMLCLEARKYFLADYFCDEKNKTQIREYLKFSDVAVCDADSEFYRSIGEKKGEKTVLIFFSRNADHPGCALHRPFDTDAYLKLISLYADNKNEKAPEEKLTFDKAGRSVNFKGKTVFLTQKESELFGLFAENGSKTLTRDEIKKTVFGITDEGSNIDCVYVNYIRKKFKQSFGFDPIETVRNSGYRFGNKTLQGK